VNYLPTVITRHVSPISRRLEQGAAYRGDYATGAIASGESNSDSPSGQVVGAERWSSICGKRAPTTPSRPSVLRVDSPGGIRDRVGRDLA